MNNNQSYWNIGSLAICVLCMFFCPIVGLPMLILYILACVLKDKEVAGTKEKAEEEHSRRVDAAIQRSLDELAAMYPRERKQRISQHINCVKTPEIVKRYMDVFPKDTEEVLGDLGLVYDEKNRTVTSILDGMVYRDYIKPKKTR